MNAVDFNLLPDSTKKKILVDAHIVCEVKGDKLLHLLFQVDNFYIEVTRNTIYRSRRIVGAYELHEVPVMYTLAHNHTGGI